MIRPTIACLLLSACACASAAAPPMTVSVSGEGVETAQPDEGYVRGGVVTVAPTSALALASNAEAMDKVRKAIAAAGVDLDAAVQTYQFSIDDHYADDGAAAGRRTRRKDGYQVTHKVRVHAARIEALGPILDAMVAAGANDIDGVTLECSTADARRAAARKLAAQDARERASAIAEALGYRLGTLASIQEGASGGRPRPFDGGRMMALSASAAPTEISGGTLEYHASVSATWNLVTEEDARGRKAMTTGPR